MKPDYTDLFVLEDPFSKRYMRLTIVDARYEADSFENFVRLFFRGDCNVNPPLLLQYKMGGQPADIIWTDYPPITIISQKVKDLLISEGFTGWKTYDVNILDKEGQPMAGYHGLSITGIAGGQDYKRGIVVDKQPIVPTGKPYQVLKGFYFEADYWDGSDFTIVSGRKPIIVTGRVVDAFKKAKIKNVEFIGLKEREIALDTLEIWGVWPPK